MATYKGQKKVDVSSYAKFKNAILGNGYDVDNTYGCQCVSANTFVSMEDGTYKPIETLEIGDVVKGGNKVISNEPQQAEMYKVYTSMGTFRVSKNHRFILENEDECLVENVLNKVIKLDNEEPTKQYDLTCDELKFLGFYLGDGTKTYRWANSTKPTIFVTIGTELKRKYIESLNIKLTHRKHSNKAADTYSLINKEHPILCEVINYLNGKDLPRLFTKEQYQYIIEGYLSADGYIKGNSVVATSVDKELLLSIQYGCILNNWRAKLSEPYERIETNFCKNPKPIYRLSINKNYNAKAKVFKSERIDDDYVYVLNLDGNHQYYGDNHKHHNCYDLASLFWLNACGRWVTSATKDGGVKGGASGIWGARTQNNKGNEFELITNVKNLKQGDIIITNNGKYGHICFLDKDGYVLGQNQGGTGGKMPGAKCCVIKWNYKKYFLGAFRYKKWNTTITKKVSATAGLWLRDKKGTSSKKVKLLVYGTKVEVLEANAGTANGYTWSKIKVSGKTGYVASKYLK